MIERLKLVALVAVYTVLVLFMGSAFAHAQSVSPILIGTYAGPQPSTFCNTPFTYAGVDGSGTASTINPEADPIAGSAYISYTADNASAGDTVYTTACNAQLAGSTATILLMGDDSVTLTINGQVIASASPYDTILSFNVPAGVFVNGVNTITATVTNGYGLTGVDFLITVTPPATSPSDNITFTGSMLVNLGDATPSINICYSYNATALPVTDHHGGCAAGTPYTAPFLINTTQTIYAVAGGPFNADSPVSSVTFTLVPAQ